MSTESSLASLCVPSTFNLPVLLGTEVVRVEANVYTYNSTVRTYTFSQPTVHIETTFCNVTVSYTHPGQDDLIHVEAWLPSPEAWNDRLVGVGGGGFTAGRSAMEYDVYMAPQVVRGYAAVTTDAGVDGVEGYWSYLSPGNSHLVNIHNFAGRSLEEQGLLGKGLAGAMYGRGPAYSYFTGCSQGGRQALTIAQRYPGLYDGVFANAPAIPIAGVIPAIHWPQQHMVNEGEVPHECEVDAVTAEAIAFCDTLDLVEDGIVAEPEECLSRFDPFSVVGKVVPCADADGGQLAVSHVAAGVVNASWHGPETIQGRRIWPGVTPGSDLTGNRPYSEGAGFGVANTNCSSGVCVGKPYPVTIPFFRAFLARDLSLDLASLPRSEYDRLVAYGRHELTSMDATDPDLLDFQRAGGKMITYHGTDDSHIPLWGTTKYYGEVSAVSPDVHSFYRVFPVPGMAHCFGGQGGYPDALFDQLRDWVEKGSAPASSPYEAVTLAGDIHKRILCPVPQKPAFDEDCGDVAQEACWSCSGDL